MVVKRVCIKKLKNIISRIRFRLKLKRMDDWWYLMGGSCFGLFPPSFYYTHTEEEMKRITDRELDKLRAIRDKYFSEYDPKPQESRKEVE